MKKLISLLAAFALVSAFVSCGNEPTAEISEDSEQTTETVTTAETPEETTESDMAESFFQECHKTIDNAEKPEVIRISFEGKCADNIKKHAKVSDLYNVHVLHSGVVGLIGVPIELEYDEEVTEPRLTFTYDTSELRGVPEKNLVMLHYNENDSFYDTVEKFSLNTDECTVSADIKEQGVYLLADAYQWYGAWGMDVSEYAYEVDPAEYLTDWERENDTGDIIKLADKEWAIENAPEFHVSTPEQLASVVWFVNGIRSESNTNFVAVILEDDIDLTGYDWKPMGWSKNAFGGVVDGAGHTITGMTIKEGYVDSGFIGYGLSTSVSNITFVDANVSATGCTGIVGGQVYMSDVWSDIHVSGKVSGGSDDYGAIIGREAGTTFKNCTADVTVDGEPFEYLSYRQKREDEVEIVETFHITLNDDGTITRDEHDGFMNLGWQIMRNDQHMLQRNAEGETTYDLMGYIGDTPGNYKVYVCAYINGTYIRVSNLIEFTI